MPEAVRGAGSAPGFLVYVDRSTVRPGRADELRAAIATFAAEVEELQPRLLAFGAAVSDDGRQLVVVHVHVDPASLDAHLEAMAAGFGRFAELLDLRSIDVYGRPSAAAIERLRAKVALLGGASVAVHPLRDGFSRLPAAAASR